MANDPVKLDYSKPDRRSSRALITILIGVLGIFVAGAGIAIVFMPMPSLRGPQIPSNRIRCAMSLRIIGQAMLLYASEYGGRYPNHIEDLLVEEITPDAFVCASSNDTVAAVGPTTQVTAANLLAGGHLSYIYCGAGFGRSSPDDTVVVYEPFSNHAGDGSNVLFGDGHVEFITAVLMKKMLAEMSLGHNPPRRDKLK